MSMTVVERLYDEYKDLITVLDGAEELSLRNSAEDSSRKALLLAAASHFEYRLSEDVVAFVDKTSTGNPLVVSFFRNKAVSRQYHTWFDWKGKNANQFFGLFGEKFASYMQSRVRSDEALAQGIRAFLELGQERNRLVHEDFGTFALEKTTEEIFQKYLCAKIFVQTLPLALQNFSEILEEQAKELGATDT